MKIPLETIVPYWGSRIKYSYQDGANTYTSENATVNLKTLQDLDSFNLKSVLLYLKPLNRLKDEEVLKIANWVVNSEVPIKFEISENEESIQAFNSVYFIDIFFSPFFISAVNLKEPEEIQVIHNLGLIFNYLRIHSYSCDGLLENGLALEIE